MLDTAYVPNATIERVTFMIAYGEEMRCDATLTRDKTYYRMMSDDTLEDGELPGLKERFDEKVKALIDSFRAGVSMSSSIEPIRFKLFVNNLQVTPAVLNKDTMRDFIDKLADMYDEFRALCF